MIDLTPLKEKDFDVYQALVEELGRQEDHLELIASENFVSPAVMLAAGTHLTNKYAEGYPSKRFYGGCEFVDKIETLAIERAKQLFGAEHANVQPHCGSSANLQVYYALLKLGDTVLGMDLNHGGHLTHGSPASISGTYFNFVPYGVSKATGYIDYDEVERIAVQCQPKLIIAGASAYAREIDFARFKEICDKVGALFMVDMAHIAGLVATGLHSSPIPYADVVTSTTHKTLRGPRSGLILCKSKYQKAIDRAVFPGTQGGPLMHIIAAKAIAFKEAASEEFKRYCAQVVANAKALARTLMDEGIKLFSSGTDNHLMLLDLRGTGCRGKELEKMLDSVNITTNKNTIPFDDASPFDPNGLRLGTPGVTTRGMTEAQMTIIGKSIVKIIKYKDAAACEVKAEVAKLTNAFPLYKHSIKVI